MVVCRMFHFGRAVNLVVNVVWVGTCCLGLRLIGVLVVRVASYGRRWWRGRGCLASRSEIVGILGLDVLEWFMRAPIDRGVELRSGCLDRRRGRLLAEDVGIGISA